MNNYISYVIKYYPTEAPKQVLKDHGKLSEEDFCKLRFEAGLGDCQAIDRSRKEDGPI